MLYNLAVVFDCDKTHVLMCRRRKNPYQGMLNFVGGKIKDGEDHAQAAYRELREETSISGKNIQLIHVMGFAYPLEDGLMEVYAGILSSKVAISSSENELLWINTNDNFFDTERFAGCGNIYHIMNYIKTYKAQIFTNEKI